jgi:mannosyltransferase OCH1-like enzyme
MVYRRASILLYGITLVTLFLFSRYTLQTYSVPHEWPALTPHSAGTIRGVPLNIFVTWNSREIPYYMKRHLEELHASQPEFSLTVYSHKECRKYIQDRYPTEVLEAYDSLVPGAYRSDLFRYCKLYMDGGVYIDIKYQVHASLAKMIQDSPFQLIQDDPNEIPGCMHNAFMISPPSNPVFQKCIERVVKNCKERAYHRHALDITGPCVLGDALKAVQPTFQTPYQFSWATREVYDLQGGNKLLTEYTQYRTEQKRHMKAIDYREAWTEKRVYR